MPEQVIGVTTKQGDLQNLNSLLAAGLTASGKIGLYLASWNPSRNSLFVDAVANEATFDGYARATTAFSAEGVDQNGVARTLSGNELFTADTVVTPESLGGAFLTWEEAGPPILAKLMAFYPFSLPISINQPGQSIGVKVVITAPDLSGYAMIEG